MKKLSLKSKVLLGAFFLASSVAAAQEVVYRMTNLQQPEYNWQRIDGQPTDAFTGTQSQAETRYGCSGDGADCARGVDPNGELPDVVIQHN